MACSPPIFPTSARPFHLTSEQVESPQLWVRGILRALRREAARVHICCLFVGKIGWIVRSIGREEIGAGQTTQRSLGMIHLLHLAGYVVFFSSDDFLLDRSFLAKEKWKRCPKFFDQVNISQLTVRSTTWYEMNTIQTMIPDQNGHLHQMPRRKATH